MNFTSPTPVQEASIEAMLHGEDLLVQAPTGTGKTGAFGIPAVEGADPRSRKIQTLILCPTRELAIQITGVLQNIASYRPGIRVQALYGGEHISRQINALRRKPQIVVATPGRLMDHMQRRTVRLGNVTQIILDEADRMLDMGFRDDIDTILQRVPEERQTVLFSATLSPEIRSIAAQYQQDVRKIRIQGETLSVDSVDQYYSEVRGSNKTSMLINLFEQNSFRLSLVFVATKSMADTLATQLNESGLKAGSLHGDLRQKQRDIVMDKYRRGKINVLVATDVAARGIDVSGIEAVINYDIPGNSEAYVHRIGRTGRASRTGTAYTLLYPRERGRLKEIIRVTGAHIAPVSLHGDNEVAAFPPSRAPRNGGGRGRASASGRYHGNRPKRNHSRNAQASA